MQYEDGDTEELLASELKKKKLLQPAGPQDRTDYAELDRLYVAAKVQWAKGMPTHRTKAPLQAKGFAAMLSPRSPFLPGICLQLSADVCSS